MAKDGEALGWTYECVLQNSDLKKSVSKLKSEAPVITKETLDEKGMAIVRFDNLMITPWGRVNGQFVSYGLTATAYKATLVPNK